MALVVANSTISPLNTLGLHIVQQGEEPGHKYVRSSPGQASNINEEILRRKVLSLGQKQPTNSGLIPGKTSKKNNKGTINYSHYTFRSGQMIVIIRQEKLQNYLPRY